MNAAHQETGPVRSISIQQWGEWARSGAAPTVTIRLDGDSMRPLIRRNRDAVTIQPLSRPLKLGDIVLFQNHAGQYVVHRVWKLRGAQVRTLGDNCWNPDPWMDAGQVLGLVVSTQRNARVWQLNTRLARSLGRTWMALRPLRNLWRTGKNRAGRILRWYRR